MSHHTTSPLPASPLVQELLRLLAAHRPACRQERSFHRLVALTLAQLFAFARHTITQALLALGLHEADWSAWYRLFWVPRVDYDELTRCYLRQTLDVIPTEGPLVAVVDGVQIPRQSRRMPGTAWLKDPHTPPFKPGIWRAQRFCHLAGLLPPEEGYSRALPLRIEPAFPPKAVPAAGNEPRREWEAGRASLSWLRTELDAAGREEQWVLALADGNYDVADLWRALPGRVSLLARTARNRVLFALPDPPSGRGAPRKYGPQAPKPAAWLKESTGWKRTQLVVRGRPIPVQYRVEGPYLRRTAAQQPLFLLVVRGTGRSGRRKEREPAFWLVSAVPGPAGWELPLPAEELLAWAWQRWEVEVCHRELKTTWGWGEIQCWAPIATVRSVQWQAWAYGVVVLAGYRCWGLITSPLRPPGRWWRGARRWSLGTLWRGYRQALGTTAEFQPLWTRTGANWAEKATWLGGLYNAMYASLRT